MKSLAYILKYILKIQGFTYENEKVLKMLVYSSLVLHRHTQIKKKENKLFTSYIKVKMSQNNQHSWERPDL